MPKKEGFPTKYDTDGGADFLTPLDAPRQAKEPGPNQVVINEKTIPDPLGIVSPIPAVPLRKIKGS